jgi:hypothetical protein
MATEVTREELVALEREVEGEKLVTRHILEQTRRNGDDLAAVKSRLDRVEQKLDGLERKFDGFERKSTTWAGTCPRSSERSCGTCSTSGIASPDGGGAVGGLTTTGKSAHSGN